MLNPVFAMLSVISNFFRREEGQDTFEYVLIIGVLVVAILIAVATPVGSALINSVVGAVETAVCALPNMNGCA